MRINIITGTKEQFNHAIPYATCVATTMYKVVYNFWFAQEKSARMEDDSWD